MTEAVLDAQGDVHHISMQENLSASTAAEQLGLPSHDASRQEHQEHPGTKGQLAVDIRQETICHDPVYSTGGAPSDLAQDTTVATAPPAAALPDKHAGMAADSTEPVRPDTDASSPSTDHDSMPEGVAPLTAVSLAPVAHHATHIQQQQEQLLQHMQQEQHQHQHQQLLQHMRNLGQQQQQAGGPEQAAVVSETAADSQQQRLLPPPQHQQHQQYSLGLELLGEAAGLLPSEGHMQAAAAVSASRPGMPLLQVAPSRHARMSHNNQLIDGDMYMPPDHLPMPTGITIPKPEGVQCQVPGCHSNLNAAGVSTYFRRHRVCLSHAKADQVPINGMAMRFCQQCGIMHPLADFDGARKSCRVQLDRHNLRRRCRRKTQLTKIQQRKPESGSRGGGGSSVSPSGMGGGSSPPRTSGGKRAAARAAAAAFAAAAASDSGVTDETSRDREVEGGYAYSDADWMGDMYGATNGAHPGLDPAAAAATISMGGGYYQMPGSGGHGIKESSSMNAIWSDALGDAGGYPGSMPSHPAAQLKADHGMGSANGAYGLHSMAADGNAAAAAAAYIDQHMMGGYEQMGYNQHETQHQAAAMQRWHSSSMPAMTGGAAAAAAGPWGVEGMATCGGSTNYDMAAAGGNAAVSGSGAQLTLQQLRLHIASVLAAGTGAGMAAIRNLGFVQQLLVVDELANGLMAEIKKASGASSTAGDSRPDAVSAGSGYRSHQGQQASGKAAGAVQHAAAAAGGAPGAAGGGMGDAAAAAAAGGAAPPQLLQLLSQLSRAPDVAEQGQQAGPGAGAVSLISPRNGPGRAQVKREPLDRTPQLQGPAPKRQRPESGAGERGGAAVVGIPGVDATWLRHLLRYASNAGASAADVVAAAAAATGAPPQQQKPHAAPQAADAVLADEVAAAVPEDTVALRAGDGTGAAASTDAATDKSAMLSAALSLLQAAGVKVDGGNQQTPALQSSGRNGSSSRGPPNGPAVSPAMQGSRAAAAGNSRGAAGPDAGNAAGGGRGPRSARESSSQLDGKATQAALLRTLASGLQSMGDANTQQGPSGPGSGGRAASGSGLCADGVGPACGVSSNSAAQQLLSSLLQSLTAAKRQA